jgi:hypothetical protein
MDQSTEAISSPDPPRRRRDNWHAGSEWRRLRQGAMRTMAVVVIGILTHHRYQVPTSKDEHPVQALAADRGHPPLRIGIRPRCPHRRGAYLDPLGGKDGVEGWSELRVPIAEQQPEAADTVFEIHQQVAACCATHSPTGCDVTPSTCTWRLATSITNSAYSCCNNTVSTVKKSTARMPLAWARRNCRHETADRVGAGATPARWRMVHTVLAPTL